MSNGVLEGLEAPHRFANCWLVRLLSFKRPLLSVDVSVRVSRVGNVDAKYLRN